MAQTLNFLYLSRLASGLSAVEQLYGRDVPRHAILKTRNAQELHVAMQEQKQRDLTLYKDTQAMLLHRQGRLHFEVAPHQ